MVPSQLLHHDPTCPLPKVAETRVHVWRFSKVYSYSRVVVVLVALWLGWVVVCEVELAGGLDVDVDLGVLVVDVVWAVVVVVLDRQSRPGLSPHAAVELLLTPLPGTHW